MNVIFAVQNSVVVKTQQTLEPVYDCGTPFTHHLPKELVKPFETDKYLSRRRKKLCVSGHPTDPRKFPSKKKLGSGIFL